MNRLHQRLPSKKIACLVVTLLFMSAENGSPSTLKAAENFQADLIIYGGTSSGVIAAVQARKMGKTAIIVGPDKHLGGLTSSGLGFTDTGNKAVIGGLSRDFYHRIWQAYQKSETWRWQKQSDYGNKGQWTPAMDGENRTMWIFEPHIAESVFEDYVREFKIPVYRDEWLDREKGVRKNGARIVSITMLSGNTYSGKMFLDATYEGDLMAAAKIDYHVGREANSTYGENWNGVQVGVLHHRHHFGAVKEKISPYIVPGDPASGVLPRISTEPPGEYGDGDHRVQAYCYRYCATDHPENRIPFPKPEGYDPSQYELLIRVYEAGWKETFDKFDPLPNHKTDTNNHGPFSTDNIGMNYDYPEATYERRQEILAEHRQYQQGWLYFVANDPRVPGETRERMANWGLPKDEFKDNGNWPHQIYVREARRMIGKFVMTENELTKKKPTPDSVGMGSYTIDSHNVQRYITPDGYVQNEGDIGVGISPYAIAYGSMVPKRDQCDNLMVTVCVSSSHIAFGSIRMEPVFMILGQSAATAASMAIDKGIAVQDVAYDTLKEQLLKDGQVLEYANAAPGGNAHSQKTFVDPSKLPGIVIDDDNAIFTGDWKTSSASNYFVANGYHHDNAAMDGKASVKFETRLPKTGQYDVRLCWPPNANRSSKVMIEIQTAAGVKTVTINQRKAPNGEDHFQSIGTFDFSSDQAAAVSITNKDTDGYVVIDAIQWIAL